MKRKIVPLLLVVSIALNMFFFGKWFLESLFGQTQEDKEILSELVAKTVASEQFKQLSDKENIIAIGTGKDLKGAYPFTLGVHVMTDQETHIFSCKNSNCSIITNESWSNSRYEKEKPRLPLN